MQLTPGFRALMLVTDVIQLTIGLYQSTAYLESYVKNVFAISCPFISTKTMSYVTANMAFAAVIRLKQQCSILLILSHPAWKWVIYAHF